MGRRSWLRLDLANPTTRAFAVRSLQRSVPSVSPSSTAGIVAGQEWDLGTVKPGTFPSVWLLDWGSKEKYSGKLSIHRQLNERHYQGKLWVLYKGKGVTQDADIKITGDNVTIICTNADTSPWSPDDFFLTLSKNVMQGYSRDKKGGGGPARFTAIIEGRPSALPPPPSVSPPAVEKPKKDKITVLPARAGKEELSKPKPEPEAQAEPVFVPPPQPRTVQPQKAPKATESSIAPPPRKW